MHNARDAMSDDALRTKLEGTEPLLRAVHLRLRKLVSALSSRRWEAELRALAADVRAHVADDALHRALSHAVRHAEAEGWPRGALSTLIRSVRDDDAALRAQLERRGHPLDVLLHEVLTAPHRVAPERRLDVLTALFPDEDPALRSFADAVDAFRREPTVATFDAASAHDLAPVDAAWQRVQTVDPHLARWLRETALPVSAGARLVLRAHRAREHLEGHFTDVLAHRFVAVTLRDDEKGRCFRFCLARAHDGAARLSSSPRDALLMLANELSGQPTTRPALVGGRTQVEAWARAADTQQDDDWKALRAWLRSLKPVRALPPLQRGPETLLDLL